MQRLGQVVGRHKRGTVTGGGGGGGGADMFRLFTAFLAILEVADLGEFLVVLIGKRRTWAIAIRRGSYKSLFLLNSGHFP